VLSAITLKMTVSNHEQEEGAEGGGGAPTPHQTKDLTKYTTQSHGVKENNMKIPCYIVAITC